MAKILDLIYRVTDKATPGIKKVKTAQDGLNLSMKDAIKIGTAMAGALTTVGTSVIKLIDGYQSYTIAAGELAIKLGVTVEEASAMLEVSQDLGIETSTLEMAFKKMASEGIDPSIAGFAEVRRRLDETTSSSERLALAQKLLGRAGADLLPMFDQLTNEQLANYVATMGEAQVVTEAEFQAALKNRQAIAEMADVYENAKLAIGGFLAEGLIPYVGILQSIPAVLDAIIERWHILLSLPAPQMPTGKPVGKGGSSSPGNTPKDRRSGPPEAAGGPVSGGTTYLVGEKGPELFTPGQSGAITPNIDQLSRSIDRLVATLPVILRDAVQKR